MRELSRVKPGSRRFGRGPVDVIVVLGLVGFAAVLVLMGLPRGRETARFAGCQDNLRRIGVGLAMYHQSRGAYPTIPTQIGSTAGGPIAAMLDTLAIPDLLDLRDPGQPPKPTAGPPPGIRLPGLACPSDPNAMGRLAIPVISYRANTGDDPKGQGGPFQPGRTMTSAEVETADGLSYTAAFAERLVGDGKDGRASPANYASTPGPIDRNGCPDSPPVRWRGDAGSDWAEASWRSTLYNHALVPNVESSCIAEDGRAARIGASSGHVNRVNLLMMDGSVRAISPSVEPRVWAGLGTVKSSAP